MLQPPQGHEECPRCGYKKAILIMDFDGLFPQLDGMGYPQYHCPNCANVFTAGDIQHDEQGKDDKKEKQEE